MIRFVAIFPLAGLIVVGLFVGVFKLYDYYVDPFRQVPVEEPLRRASTPPNTALGPRLDFVAFVGEHISMREIESASDVPPFNFEFQAKYRIIDVVHGSYDAPEIDFFVHDHHGNPEFSKYETVLLYVSRYGEFWIHEKYQFDPVYPTVSGEWSGCGDPYARESAVHQGDVAPTNVHFDPPVRFDISSLELPEAERKYPKRFFLHGRRAAICYAGAPAHALFEIKRDGVLTARGLF